MADPVSLLVSPIIKIALDQIYSVIKEGFLSFYEVKKDVENLKSMLTAIQTVLEDAEDKQLKNHSLRNWLENLTEAAYDAEDILNSWATEYNRWKMKQQVHNFLPTFSRKASFQFDIALEIKKIVTRLDKIAQERHHFQLNVKLLDNGTPAGTRISQQHTGSAVIESDVVGRDSDKENIVELLVSDDEVGDVISVIPIIGMGGLGKTTLARLVYNDERVKSHFERMWVCVTDDFDLTRILIEMIPSDRKHGIKSLSMNQLQERLQEFLSAKRFLLVLDDVWTSNYKKWQPLETLLNKGGKGSRVLVTGRTTDILNIMGRPRESYLLSCLPENECWSLFKKSAFIEDSSMGGALEEYGKAIVGKCSGLPLAIVHMGSLLRGKADVNEWKKIMESEIWELEKSDSNSKNENYTILPALRLSFNHLSFNLKQCFAYCSIFPKAYEFDKDELVKLWVAENFILPSNNERIEDTGSNYFENLLMRFFFQHPSNDNKRYTMHDLIHDLAQSVSRPYCCQVKDTKASHISEKTRRVSFHYKDVEQPPLDFIDRCKKLRTLLLPGRNLKAFGQEALDKMFRTLRYIRVLDLSSSTLLALPKSIEMLTLLRYLDLSKTEIEKLPNSICSLYNLQTLKLLGCPCIFELPKDIANLINLRHLELDEMFWYKLSMLPPRMGSLTGLHNLHVFWVGGKSGYKIEELGNMVYLTGTLCISKLENAENAGEAKLKDKKRLQKVVLEWSDHRDVDPLDEAADNEEKKALEDLQPYSNLKELQICHYRGTEFPGWMRNGLLQNMVTLRLNCCTKCKILSIGELPHLGELYIKGMHDLLEWPTMLYPSLNRLKISKCPKLRVLPSIFPRLRVMKIKKCESLEALPIAPLQFLTLVDNLVLQHWNEKDVQITSVNNEGQEITVDATSFSFLLEMKIVNCPMLHALPQNFYPQKLEISGCNSLSALPDPEHSQRLQHLALEACDATLVKSIPGTSTLYSLVISDISNLDSFPKWPNLPGIKALYIRDCKDLVSLSEQEDGSLQGLTSLKLLSIQNCPKLVMLPDKGLPTMLDRLSIGSCRSLESFGPKDIFKSLTALNDLYIEDCHALLSLPEEGLSTSLQHLRIQGCPALMEQCQKEGRDWQKIMDIPDLEIETASSTTSAAWYHHFRCCRGIDIRESGQRQRKPNSHGSMQRDKGQSLNGKMEPAEPSSSAEHRQSSKGKSVLAEPSSTAVHRQNLKGKMALAEPSSSAEHKQSSEGKIVLAEPSSSAEQSQ